MAILGYRSGNELPAFLLEMVGIAVLLASGLQGVIGGRRHRHRRVREVRATADGLEAHSGAGWQRYAWGGLKSLRRIGVFWVVTSTDGDLWLPPGLAHRERLLHAIRQAIEARQAGFSLPRMSGEVPAAALSRAALSVDAERGLSRDG
ncbi:MAG: hypothetical protein HZB16_05025 [Armatimonadetes bacterium]|nr:hypothetical protein [Armatimonadota bacterium]